jgi:hypothetical protein
MTESRVDKFLASVASQPQRRGNLIFGLDATASRERTWDAACQLQAQMFREVATIDTLSMHLVYFRGVRGLGGECRASSWVEDPMVLAGTMSKIKCDAGNTQIERVLNHASQEMVRRKINALVYVGDCCEESRDPIVEAATQLARVEVPVFMFQEGHDPIAAQLFQEISRLTKGAYHRFDQRSLSQLAEILRAISIFAVGGIAALERQGSAAAKLLLAQVGRRQ